jgi:hypothetical protein
MSRSGARSDQPPRSASNNRTLLLVSAFCTALFLAADGDARSPVSQELRAACVKKCSKALEPYKKEVDKARRELICRARCMRR